MNALGPYVTLAAMSHRSSVHDLKSLVLSFHSLIAIETVEEERVRSLLIEVASDLRQPFYEWSITAGLQRLRGATIDGTADALAALRHIERIDGDNIYLLKDLAPHLSNANTARALRDLAPTVEQAGDEQLVLIAEPQGDARPERRRRDVERRAQLLVGRHRVLPRPRRHLRRRRHARRRRPR